MILGDLQSCLGLECEALMNGVNAPIEEILQSSLTPSSVSGYSKKTTVCEPGRRLYQTANLLGSWFRLPSLQIYEWWISVAYKPRSLWYFIITIWMDYDTIIFLLKIKKNFFFKWTVFKVLSLLHHCFCFLFLVFECKLCGILAPWSGIQPVSLHRKAKSLTIGLPGKSHYVHF